MATPLSRRGFLQASAGVAGLAMMGGSSSQSAQDKKFAGFVIGIQSYSLRGFPVEQAIQHAKDLGCEHMEFYDGQFKVDSTPEQISAMKAKMQSLGMKMFGHGVNRFSKNHEANRKLFVFAKAVGLRNLTADPEPDSFDSLDSLVKEFDVRIAIHNHGPSHRYNKVVDVLQAIKGRDARIGACADLGHFIRSGENPVEVIRSLGDRLYGIHLKDFAEQKDKTKGVILGKGHLDVEGVFRALRQVNFPADGCLSLEYEENPKDPIAEIRECLTIARDAAKKAMA